MSRVVGDRFELLSEAGKGAMGSVHRARDRKTGMPVAVKLLVLERALDVARFGREATLLAQLSHPNIVGYVAHGTTTDGLHFLAQEWVDGLNLRTQIKTLGVTAREALTMGRGIANALAVAHAVGVIHRDVKPENLILAGGEPSQIKLVDFGIARTTDEAARLTRTGVMIGTPAYMSPEQARGASNLGPTVDVWALGCVMYEMLCGRAPFAGQTPMAIRAKVLFDLHAPLAPLCPEAPPQLVKLVEQMLAKDLDERPATGQEIAAALRMTPEPPDGPRRRGGLSEPATAAMRVRPAAGAPPAPVAPIAGGPTATPAEVAAAVAAARDVNCFVFFNTLESAAPSDTITDHSEALGRTAARHGMSVHMLEDGSAVLRSSHPGREAAVHATRAALELQDLMPSAAVSVVGQTPDSSMDAALERGGLALERSAMRSLFGEIVGEAGAAVQVDDVIADLVQGELTIEQDEHGPIVRAAQNR